MQHISGLRQLIVEIFITQLHTHIKLDTHNLTHTRVGVSKYLTRNTSWCRRTESIVPLERGVYSCAGFEVFSVYSGWKHVRRRARLQQRRDASCHQVFPLQGKAPKHIHVILIEILVEHAPLYTNVKNWVVQFKRGDFSTCDAPRPWRPKTEPTPEIIYQNHELILEDRRISAKSIAE
jgi:hypothetical protein